MLAGRRLRGRGRAPAPLARRRRRLCPRVLSARSRWRAGCAARSLRSACGSRPGPRGPRRAGRRAGRGPRPLLLAPPGRRAAPLPKVFWKARGRLAQRGPRHGSRAGWGARRRPAGREAGTGCDIRKAGWGGSPPREPSVRAGRPCGQAPGPCDPGWARRDSRRWGPGPWAQRWIAERGGSRPRGEGLAPPGGERMTAGHAGAALSRGELRLGPRKTVSTAGGPAQSWKSGHRRWEWGPKGSRHGKLGLLSPRRAVWLRVCPGAHALYAYMWGPAHTGLSRSMGGQRGHRVWMDGYRGHSFAFPNAPVNLESRRRAGKPGLRPADPGAWPVPSRGLETPSSCWRCTLTLSAPLGASLGDRIFHLWSPFWGRSPQARVF